MVTPPRAEYPGAEKVAQILRDDGKKVSEKCEDRCNYAWAQMCRIYCIEARDEAAEGKNHPTRPVE